MFCRNCGNQMDPNAVVCIKCGCAKGTGFNFCPNCGGQTIAGAAVCTRCGCGLAPAFNQQEQKSKLVAGLLGIFIGGLGIHNFYLGNTGRGVAQLILTICSCGIGGIWGFIEGILILCGNINTDANGVPLKE